MRVSDVCLYPQAVAAARKPLGDAPNTRSLAATKDAEGGLGGGGGEVEREGDVLSLRTTHSALRQSLQRKLAEAELELR